VGRRNWLGVSGAAGATRALGLADGDDVVDDAARSTPVVSMLLRNSMV
jgi:hypothetical protein